MMARLGPGICDRLQGRVLGTEGVLGAVKSDPGPLGLETLLEEIDKLKTVQALGLPDEPFGGFCLHLAPSVLQMVTPWGQVGFPRARSLGCWMGVLVSLIL